jgi:cell division transport system ATP-binding protein
MLQMRHIYKTYQNDRHVLRDLSFETSTSGLYLIKGESGSGKTTLFRLLTAMAKPTNGEITFKNWKVSQLSFNQIAKFRQNVGIIFQDYKLILNQTIYENIALPLKIRKYSTAQITQKIDAIIDQLNLNEYINEYPEHLSGGQQQKSALARALVGRPELIIADEPTGNLDAKNSLEMMRILSDYANQGAIVLVATHDQQILEQYSERVYSLENGQLRK